MNRIRPVIAMLALLCAGTAHANCPTDDASRFITIEIPGLGAEDVLVVPHVLKVRIDEHAFDRVEIGVDGDPPKRFRKSELIDLPGTDWEIRQRIGPRKLAADIIDITIAEAERRLWVKTFQQNTCKSKAEVKLHGGDSRVNAVVIGINEYKHVRPLLFAEKDAEAFEHLIRQKVRREELNLVSLYGADATGSAIREAIQRAVDNASIAGLVLVYFSGHGTLEQHKRTKVLSAYYVPQNGKLEVPSELVSHAWVTKELSTSVARSILISDSCFSGLSLTGAVRLAPAEFGVTKSLMRANTPTFATEALNRVQEWLPANPGLMWFSSSNGTEVSYESPTLQGGVFTHYLLKALDPHATYKQATTVIASKIAAEQQAWQTPKLWGDAEHHDFEFPLGPFGGAP